MNTDPEWKDLSRELKIFTIWAVSSLIDSIFLALWVFVQWIVNEYVTAKLRLSFADQWVLYGFQIIFSVSTLAPVIIYIYTDIRVMIIRARSRVRSELGKSYDADKS